MIIWDLWKYALRVCFVLLISGIIALVGCSDNKPAGKKDYNVLLISIDTLRADHLSCYGSKEVQTPNIDFLAANGVLFENAEVHAPMTLPSHTSMLTGVLPATHGIMDNGAFYARDSLVTMAEILKENGYVTGAIVSTFVLNRQYGLDQGFDSYDDEFRHFGTDVSGSASSKKEGHFERDGDSTTDAAEEWLRKNKDHRFFLWLHYFDPHFPYKPPSPYLEKYSAEPYKGEVAFADAYIGRLVKTMSELNLDQQTLIILTSDHGEGLHEHGEYTHGYFVYESTSRVPLIFYAPSMLPRERRVPGVARSIDILPTVLDFLELQPPKTIQGKSLLPVIQSDSAKLELESYGEAMAGYFEHGWSPLCSLRTYEWKYIHAPEPELYNLLDDPAELRNLVDDEPEIAQSMRKRLKQIYEDSKERTPPESASMEMDQDTRKRLESLGYIAGFKKDAGPSESSFETTGVDPKEMINFLDEFNLGKGYAAMGDYDEALIHVGKALQDDPDNVIVQIDHAQILLELNRLDESIDLLEKVKKKRPDLKDVHVYLNRAYYEKGDMENAALEASEVIRLFPKRADAYYSLAIANMGLGKVDRLEALFGKAVDLDPDHILYRNGLGTELMRQRRYEEAVNQFRKVLESDPSVVEVLTNLAACLIQLNRPEQALAEAQKAIDYNPDYAEARLLVGSALMKQEAFEQAEKSFEKAIELDPEDPDTWYNYACVESRLGKVPEALSSLEKAIEYGGERYRRMAAVDHDLKNIAEEKAFRRLIRQP